MRAENPTALRFILQDDIYLLQTDKTAILDTPTIAVPEIIPAPVVEQPVALVVKETPATVFNYLGQNKKRFLVITHYLTEQHIADAHLTALQNILKRKEYGIDDVAIFNIAKTANPAYAELIAYFKPEKLLILGKNAIPANSEALVLNQPKQLQSCAVLYSFSFDEMMDSTDHKKAFWDQMKNL
ncbi:MAG: hypothetical protein V4560_01595 [Bacteroidota bacterium]